MLRLQGTVGEDFLLFYWSSGVFLITSISGISSLCILLPVLPF